MYYISLHKSNSCTIKLNCLQVVNKAPKLQTTTIFAVSNTNKLFCTCMTHFHNKFYIPNYNGSLYIANRRQKVVLPGCFSNPPCHGTKKPQWMEYVNQLLQSLLPYAAKPKTGKHDKINTFVNVRICHVNMFISTIIHYQWNRSG